MTTNAEKEIETIPPYSGSESDTEASEEGEKQIQAREQRQRNSTTPNKTENENTSGGGGERTRRNSSRNLSSTTMERSWSLNDGYSISAVDEDEKVPDEEGKGGIGEDSFTVTWDDDDPMNPRTISTPRRWLIAVVVSLGSLCV